MLFHFQDFARDVRGNLVPGMIPLRSGRVTLGDRYGGDRSWASIEWTLATSKAHAMLEVRSDGDGSVMLSWALPGAAVYVTIDSPALRDLARRLIPGYAKRAVSLRVFDGSVWWSLWMNPDEWLRIDPRWRRGRFNVVETLLGAHVRSERPKGSCAVRIPMPEGAYPAFVHRAEVTWKRPRWPFPIVEHRALVEVTAPGGIPFAGKGENSWDCGTDGLRSSWLKAITVGEAVAAVVKDVLTTRERRDGDPMAKYPPPKSATPEPAKRARKRKRAKKR